MKILAVILLVPSFALAAPKNRPASQRDVTDLLSVVRSTRPAEREAALDQLADPIPTPGLNDKYLSLLDDGDMDVRDAAIKALTKMKEPKALPRIRKALKDLPRHPFEPTAGMKKENMAEYNHALAAAEALAEFQDESAIPDILSRESLSPSWAAIVPKFGRKALPLVVEKSRSKRDAVRNGAIRTIAATSDEAAVPELKALLNEKDDLIKNSAVIALVNMKSAEAREAADQAYSGLNDPGKVHVLTSCLKKCDRQKTEARIADFFKNSQVAYTKIEVLMGLGQSGDKSWVPSLEKLLADRDSGVRAQAACSLAQLTGKLYDYTRDGNALGFESGCPAIQTLKKSQK
jgi:HEAT repeat protein